MPRITAHDLLGAVRTRVEHASLRLTPARWSSAGYSFGWAAGRYFTSAERQDLEAEITRLKAGGDGEAARNREFQRDQILPMIERAPMSHVESLAAENALMRLQLKVKKDSTLSPRARDFRLTLLDTARMYVVSPRDLVATLYIQALKGGAMLGAMIGSHRLPAPAEAHLLTVNGQSLLDYKTCAHELNRLKALPQSDQSALRIADLDFLQQDVIRWLVPMGRLGSDLENQERFLYEALSATAKAKIPVESQQFRRLAIEEALRRVKDIPLYRPRSPDSMM